MRKVFSSNEISETSLVRDALVHSGIGVTVQNQHSGRSAVPGFRPPAEVWVELDDDYERARAVVVETIERMDGQADAPPWICSGCEEENPHSFDVCWNCGLDRGHGRA